MTQEERELLLKDLSGRLPYEVICDCLHDCHIKASAVDVEDLTVCYLYCDKWESIEYCKPYLRPMSSMTEEEKEEYDSIQCDFGIVRVDRVDEIVEFLLSHHFDYRGLIEKGLALEAPEGMYK